MVEKIAAGAPVALSPIVFFDNRPYIEPWVYEILADLHFAPEVYFITNSPRQSVWSKFPNVVFLKPEELNYRGKLEAFLGSYVHLSTNSWNFELACFERFFALEALMDLRGLKAAWHLDPDVWAKSSLVKIQEDCGSSTILSRLEPRNGATSAHCAHFTFEALSQLTSYLITEFYQRNLDNLNTWFNDRQARGLLGGVTDMQAIDHWLDSDSSLHWLNSEALKYSSPAINHALVEEFDLDFAGKNQLKLISRTDHFEIIYPDNSKNCFASLHFQGKYKSLIPKMARRGELAGTSKDWERTLWFSGKRYNFFRLIMTKSNLWCPSLFLRRRIHPQ